MNKLKESRTLSSNKDWVSQGRHAPSNCCIFPLHHAFQPLGGGVCSQSSDSSVFRRSKDFCSMLESHWFMQQVPFSSLESKALLSRSQLVFLNSSSSLLGSSSAPPPFPQHFLYAWQAAEGRTHSEKLICRAKTFASSYKTAASNYINKRLIYYSDNYSSDLIKKNSTMCIFFI